MGQLWRMSVWARRARRIVARRAAPVLGAALLLLAVAGCADATSTAQSRPTSTAGDLASATSTAEAGTPIPTVRPAPSPTGPGAQGGVADICSQPARVTVQPPSNIPRFPDAQLHITQVDPRDASNVFYGYCTGAAVPDVFAFYRQQLPGKGWGNVTTYAVDTVRQVKGTHGQTQITVN